MYQRMLSTLAQCEFAMTKSSHVHDMNLREQKNYESLQEKIGELKINMLLYIIVIVLLEVYFTSVFF